MSAKSSQAPPLSRREEALLRDVAEDPLSGVVERYRRLKLNRRKGNTAKEGCLAKGVLRHVPIPTRSGRIVLLKPTVQGRKWLQTRGCATGWDKWPPHSGGLEHEYWRAQVARLYEGQGYEVGLEDPVNGYADVVAEKGEVRIAVEIETGKSNWQQNIARDLQRYDQVIVVCTNDQAYEQIVRQARERWPGEGPRLKVVRAQELC